MLSKKIFGVWQHNWEFSLEQRNNNFTNKKWIDRNSSDVQYWDILMASKQNSEFPRLCFRPSLLSIPDFYIYLESHNPIFVWSNGLHHFFLSLQLWSSGATSVRVATAFYGLFSTKCRKSTVLLRVGLCESCYGFLRLFFNKMLKNTVLLRVGLQCSFDLNIFFGHYG